MGGVEEPTDRVAQLSGVRQRGDLPAAGKAGALEGPEPLARPGAGEEVGWGVRGRDHRVGQVDGERLPAYREADSLRGIETWRGGGNGRMSHG